MQSVGRDGTAVRVRDDQHVCSVELFQDSSTNSFAVVFECAECLRVVCRRAVHGDALVAMQLENPDQRIEMLGAVPRAVDED